ncbi:MAG: DNA (cytosine-5-)-methyltransferase, partial [Clostridia bacterium]|nr:DNA (cytosine-5-)-methyltransferase [Clostridia bacterium]
MQIGMFESKNEYEITKPIRLIELFGGIGCQAKALENLGIDFEHYKLCDFDKYAVQSYNAIHNTNFVPSDITQIKSEDLGIVETDKYDYIMTYSFPCQSLSLAGKQDGMARDSGTRSGLLWEVERLLKECHELPQVLLMENVPQVHGKKNIDNFNEWCEFLEGLGYKNYWQDLNAKHYGLPQNRNRTFMISLLGDYKYDFPTPFELKLRLKDMLEENVDEKYYLSEKMIKYIIADNKKWTGNNDKSLINKTIASTINTGEGSRKCDASNYICNELSENINLKTQLCNELIQSGKVKQNDVIRHSYSTSRMNKFYIQNNENNNLSPTLGTRCDCLGVVVIDGIEYRIRKLTPKECWRLMGLSDEDFDKASKKIYSTYKIMEKNAKWNVVKLKDVIDQYKLENMETYVSC